MPGTCQGHQATKFRLLANRIQVPVAIELPAAGPITYRGQYFSIDWRARLRVDIPMWTDMVAQVPMIVEAGRAESARGE